MVKELNMIFHQRRGLVRKRRMSGGKLPVWAAMSSQYSWKSTRPLTRFASYLRTNNVN